MNRQEIQKKWSEMRKNDKVARRMTQEDCAMNFISYFNRNSYGYENTDLTYVIKTLALAGVDNASARNFFYMYIRGKYGNFERNRNRSIMEEAAWLANRHIKATK